MFDTVIRGGTVITGRGPEKRDLYIRKGKIAAGSGAAEQEIDARGKLLLPGLIDPHVHFHLPVGIGFTSDDFSSGSLAALRGGVTTVIDYTTQGPDTPLERALRDRMKDAGGRTYCDYSFHCVIPAWKKLIRPQEQLAALVKLGVPTFKMFTVYAERGMKSDDADIYCAVQAAEKHGGMVCVHAESETILNFLTSQYLKTNPGAEGHALSRPAVTEWEAVQRVLAMAELAGGKIYFVHISAGRSSEILREAQARGINARGETCPQYLVMDDSVFRRPDGHLYACCPQVKKKSDSALLWKALKDGTIPVISTDSCTFNRAQKNTWNGKFTKIPYGLPGVETSLPLIYTEGVLKKRISIGRLVETMALNPAKIMGLYPRKGHLNPGADADIVIIDPKKRKAVDWRNMSTNCDWNPYQGKTLYGWPETVFLRGEMVVSGGKTAEMEPMGEFIRRKTL